jgi:ABC-type bacteriocin/lantibiotic exporter with double-glycine peptidase domain
VFFNFASKLTLDFIGIIFRLFQSLGIFNSNFHLLNAYHIYTEKLFQIETNRVASLKHNYIIKEDLADNISIKLENVSFRYFNEDEDIFQNISLEIEKNKHIVITGPNGSGKSTLLALFSGIVYPSEGKVLSFSSKFSYVSASPMILNSTLKENLTYGTANDASDYELTELIAEFKLFNEESNIKLDKNISNKVLSTGQMQKISFIRALLSKSDILLLDESTSNLDIDSKKLIFQNLNQRNLTIINATHNPEEFLNFDYHFKVSIKDGLRVITK